MTRVFGIILKFLLWCLLTIVSSPGITIVSYFGNVTASLFAITMLRKFTPP